ncbi:hypothetical protein MKW92_005631 [Papaver armeniacum]|nr:hypothetical protein MKW92_005631 [Papaver armeniacum]
MESGDDWLALDKLYHVLFCFFISILVSITIAITATTRYPFLRRWSIWIGSSGDEIGLWKSAGASTKDAIADLFGILLAYLSMLFYSSFLLLPSKARRRSDSWVCFYSQDYYIFIKINRRDTDE